MTFQEINKEEYPQRRRRYKEDFWGFSPDEYCSNKKTKRDYHRYEVQNRIPEFDGPDSVDFEDSNIL